MTYDDPHKNEEYTPLTSATDADSVEDNQSDSDPSYWRKNEHNPVYFWAGLIVAILSALNVVLLPFSLHGILPLSSSDLERLPYQRQHVGLSRLSGLTETPRPEPAFYQSWPDQITRLSKKYTETVYGTGSQIVLSSKDITLMKFQIPSKGGKLCAVGWHASPGNHNHNHTLITRSHPHSGNIIMEGDPSKVEVWSIITANASESISNLDLDEVSYHKRPIRGELLGTLDLNAANTTTVDFACPFHQGALAIELRCLLPVCYVKLDQVSSPHYAQGFSLIRRSASESDVPTLLVT